VSADPFNLQRFVDAQNPVYDQVCDELRNGQKTGHWMWFIFPQLRGLGHSSMAEQFGISSRQEAEAYPKHPLLGPRLEECTQLVSSVNGRSIQQILGTIDAMKFRSSMTLFATAAGDKAPYQAALQKYFAGEPDPLTQKKLENTPGISPSLP
jgi:uncharacterized protein (DUF1810 family)